MLRLSKENMIETSIKSIEKIYDNISQKEDLDLNKINIEKTVLVIVDMINGFVRCGALKSERIEDIIQGIVKVQKHFKENGGKIISFIDSHSENAKEFSSYPPHCIKGSGEDEVLSEIKQVGGYLEINKNSTNGFVEKEFKHFLDENQNITDFIVVGCCTDICVMQFVTTLKNYFNTENKHVNIIVPINCVETFDLDSHSGDMIDLLSLQLMEWAGAKIVSSIK